MKSEANESSSREDAETASACGCNCCQSCSTTVLQVLINMGHDPSCGACMSRAFTGSDGGYAHSC